MSDSFVTVLDELDRSIEALSKARELLSDKLEPLMTVEDVAAYWRCSVQHVFNIERSGLITREPVPGLVRFKRSAILELKVDITA